MNNQKGWNKIVYWLLIGTFITLYVCVAFVSTLHAITFFQLANTLTLAILLGAAYEIGQSSVLFAILMTHNKNRALAWAMMFLLTSLQVTANVYASFKYMDASATTDWTYWQRSILFWLEAEGPEMYKVTIAWITGALLPIVALGLTALVADNIKLMRGNINLDEYADYEYEEYEDDEYDEEIVETDSKNLPTEKIESKEKENIKEEPTALDNSEHREKEIVEEKKSDEEDEFGPVNLNKEEADKFEPIKKEKKIKPKKEKEIKPINTPRGWNLQSEFVDNAGNVFKQGKFSHKLDVINAKSEDLKKT